MSVNPVWRAEIYSNYLQKIMDAKERISKLGAEILVEVDGGINLSNILEIHPRALIYSSLDRQFSTLKIMLKL